MVTRSGKTCHVHALADEYIENICNTQSSPQIQYSPHKNINGTHHRNSKANPEIPMDLLNNLDRRSNPELNTMLVLSQ
jgi:hypothetical protein